MIPMLEKILKNSESNYIEGGYIYYDNKELCIDFDIDEGDDVPALGGLTIRKKEDIFRLVNLILDAFA